MSGCTFHGISAQCELHPLDPASMSCCPCLPSPEPELNALAPPLGSQHLHTPFLEMQCNIWSLALLLRIREAETSASLGWVYQLRHWPLASSICSVSERLALCLSPYCGPLVGSVHSQVRSSQPAAVVDAGMPGLLGSNSAAAGMCRTLGKSFPGL